MPKKPRAFRLSAPVALEREEQAALFRWAAVCACRDARYAMLFAIPNGTAASSLGEAVRAKLAGRKKGVPDVFLAVPRSRCDRTDAGLFVELKRKNGRPSDLSDEQRDWLERLRGQGYRAEVAFGWEQAKTFIEEYLS